MEQPKFQTILFVDNGQDFTEWVLKDGVVIDSQPFGHRIWAGCEVKITGSNVFVKRTAAAEFMPLKWLAETVTDTDEPYIEGYMDALEGTRHDNEYRTNQQYRWGFNVGAHNKKGGLA